MKTAHDHRHCLDEAIDKAERLCRKRGMRLTPLRRRVLELVWGGHSAVKAYDLLSALAKEHAGAAPPTVYRALEFLQEAGLVHRIQSLNAFVGCPDPGSPHSGQFMICRRCEQVEELDAKRIGTMILNQASAKGFHVEQQTVELRGLCAACGSR